MRPYAIAALVGLFLAGCHHAVAPLTVRAGEVSAASVDMAKAELGFRLFFDPKLSGNNKQSCASCHQPGNGYSNAEPTAAGINGQHGTRNPPTILGIASQTSFFWDGRAATLEAQALGPIENPVEMNAKLDEVVAKLAATDVYPKRFQAAFGTGVTAPGIAKAIAAFERTLTLDPAPYDRHELPPAQQRGQALFEGKAKCASCHPGPDFTDNGFHAVVPGPDVGRFAVTHDPADRGRFKTPTLRNVEKTAPYMHDGAVPTLDAVVELFDRGTRESAPLHLTAAEKADLVAFLTSLTSPGTNIKQIAHSTGI